MALPANYPEAAKARTEAGAEAFFRYYVEQVNAAWMQPNVDLLRPLAAPGCKACASFEDEAVQLQRKNQRYAAEAATVKRTYAFGDSAVDDKVFNLVGEIRQNRVEIVDGGGGVVSVDPQKDIKLIFSLRFEAGAWLLAESRGLQ